MGALPELFPSSGSIDRAVKIKQARQNASSVGFDNRNWLIKGERGEGIGSVTPDAGHRANCGEIVRKSGAVLSVHDFSGCMKIAGPRVVAETLPRVEDVTFRSPSQRAKIREPAEPLIIIRDNGGNLGLLEHELGDENGVGIARVTPGKIPAVLAIPAAQRTDELIFPKSHRATRINTND